MEKEVYPWIVLAVLFILSAFSAYYGWKVQKEGLEKRYDEALEALCLAEAMRIGNLSLAGDAREEMAFADEMLGGEMRKWKLWGSGRVDFLPRLAWLDAEVFSVWSERFEGCGFVGRYEGGREVECGSRILRIEVKTGEWFNLTAVCSNNCFVMLTRDGNLLPSLRSMGCRI